MKTGIDLIAEERKRQVEEEGWSAKHDDGHSLGELSLVAACYAICSTSQVAGESASKWARKPIMFPWDSEWWKPNDSTIRNLQKAGALIAAEIDRLQRVG